MGAIKVIAILVAVLFLLSRIRLKAILEYAEGGFSAKLRIGPVSLALYPPKPKKEKVAKPKKEEPTPQQEAPKPRRGGSFALVKACLPLVGECAGRLRRKLRVDCIFLDFTAAASDPAAAALAFGGANAAVGMIWPHIEQNFNVKERRIRTAADFEAKTPTIYLYGMLSLNVGQGLSLSLRLLVKFLTIYTKYRAEYPKPAPAVKTEKEAV